MTYADVLRPASRQYALAYDAVLVLGASLFMALCAQISFNIGIVPITGQTFGVMLIGALLGSRRGGLAMLAYLVEGAAGMPVFANFMSGPAVFVGGTGGYLIGFVVAAFVIGLLAERGWDRHVLTTAAAMLIGNIIIFAFGLAWLTNLFGWDVAYEAGLKPFIIGDIVKLILAALMLPAGWRLIGKEGVELEDTKANIESK
jgi:biotin transport system substrate-specific component